MNLNQRKNHIYYIITCHNMPLCKCFTIFWLWWFVVHVLSTWFRFGSFSLHIEHLPSLCPWKLNFVKCSTLTKPKLQNSCYNTVIKIAYPVTTLISYIQHCLEPRLHQFLKSRETESRRVGPLDLIFFPMERQNSHNQQNCRKFWTINET